MTIKLVHNEDITEEDKSGVNDINMTQDTKAVRTPPNGDAVYDSHKYESLDIHATTAEANAPTPA